MGSSRNPADLERYWADPARHVSRRWASGDWPLAFSFLFFALKTDSHWSAFGFEICSFMCLAPILTQYNTNNNDTERKPLHWMNFLTHKGTEMLLSTPV